MAVEIEPFVEKERLSASKLDRLRKNSRSNTPLPQQRVQHLESGWLLTPGRRPEDATPITFKSLFDLYDVAKTTVKVRGFDMKGDSTNKDFALSGVWTDITGGSEELDVDITISADTWIYVKLHRATSGQTVTLEAGASMPNGDDDDEYYPLWFVGWDAGNSMIKRDAIRDLRYALRMTGMA